MAAPETSAIKKRPLRPLQAQCDAMRVLAGVYCGADDGADRHAGTNREPAGGIVRAQRQSGQNIPPHECHRHSAHIRLSTHPANMPRKLNPTVSGTAQLRPCNHRSDGMCLWPTICIVHLDRRSRQRCAHGHRSLNVQGGGLQILLGRQKPVTNSCTAGATGGGTVALRTKVDLVAACLPPPASCS